MIPVTGRKPRFDGLTWRAIFGGTLGLALGALSLSGDWGCHSKISPTSPAVPAKGFSLSFSIPVTKDIKASLLGVASNEVYYNVTGPNMSPVTGVAGPFSTAADSGEVDFSISVPQGSARLMSFQLNNAANHQALALGAVQSDISAGVSDIWVTMGSVIRNCYVVDTSIYGGAAFFTFQSDSLSPSPPGDLASGTVAGGFALTAQGSNGIAYLGNGPLVGFDSVPATFLSTSSASKQAAGGSPSYLQAGDVYCVSLGAAGANGHAWIQIVNPNQPFGLIPPGPTGPLFCYRVNTSLPYYAYDPTTVDTNGTCPVPPPTPTNVPTNTFTPTNSSTNTPTATLTTTPTFTDTAVNTNTPTITNTPIVFTSTFTSVPTSTLTVTSSATSTDTITGTPTATPTDTTSSTATSTASYTATTTITLTATNSPSNTATNTLTGTAVSTNTPTNTATNTGTNTATSIATNTSTNTPTVTATNTLTMTTTNSTTNTATNTTTNTPTDTATSIATNTSTNTPTATAINTSTMTTTNTATNTVTNTATNTPTNTATNTGTNTPTDTPVDTSTSTPTSTPTNTVTNTPTATLTPIQVWNFDDGQTDGWALSNISGEVASTITILPGGVPAGSLYYLNLSSPFTTNAQESEISQTFSTGLNVTGGGIRAQIWLDVGTMDGNPIGQIYVESPSTSLVTSGQAYLTPGTWTQVDYPASLMTSSGYDVTNINFVAVGCYSFGGTTFTTGNVEIDDIEAY